MNSTTIHLNVTDRTSIRVIGYGPTSHGNDDLSLSWISLQLGTHNSVSIFNLNKTALLNLQGQMNRAILQRVEELEKAEKAEWADQLSKELDVEYATLAE